MAPRIVFVTGVLSALIGVAGAVVAVDLAQRLLFLGLALCGVGQAVAQHRAQRRQR